MNKKAPASLYAAFDTYPAAKGAAIHIREFSETLFRYCQSGLLLCLGNQDLPAWQIEGNVEIRRLHSEENNFLQRTFQFYDFVRAQCETVKDDLKIAHFRDPWGGTAILDVEKRKFKTVYEVNALPSIELPSRYPGVSTLTLEKIRKLEQRCLNEADAIVCPSETIKTFLDQFELDQDKISVIRNGAQIPKSVPERPENAPDKYLIYFGAVQSWQGIEVMFKAMQFLNDFEDLFLVMCVSGSKPRLKYLKKLSERLQISHKIIWNLKLPQNELFAWLAHARLSIAPLVECSRNLVQGCCPLKIVESMAYGIPIVASDLAVVRELITHNQEGWLVRPDRPSELARGIRLLLLHGENARKLGEQACNKVSSQLTWKKSKAQLEQLYQSLA